MAERHCQRHCFALCFQPPAKMSSFIFSTKKIGFYSPVCKRWSEEKPTEKEKDNFTLMALHMKLQWAVLLKDSGLPCTSGSLPGAGTFTAEPSDFALGERGNCDESGTFRLAKVLFTRAPRRSHEDWNTHRQPSSSVMDINVMRRVKKQQLTEQAESQTDCSTIREAPFIITKKKQF